MQHCMPETRQPTEPKAPPQRAQLEALQALEAMRGLAERVGQVEAQLWEDRGAREAQQTWLQALQNKQDGLVDKRATRQQDVSVSSERMSRFECALHHLAEVHDRELGAVRNCVDRHGDALAATQTTLSQRLAHAERAVEDIGRRIDRCPESPSRRLEKGFDAASSAQSGCSTPAHARLQEARLAKGGPARASCLDSVDSTKSDCVLGPRMAEVEKAIKDVVQRCVASEVLAKDAEEGWRQTQARVEEHEDSLAQLKSSVGCPDSHQVDGSWSPGWRPACQSLESRMSRLELRLSTESATRESSMASLGVLREMQDALHKEGAAATARCSRLQERVERLEQTRDDQAETETAGLREMIRAGLEELAARMESLEQSAEGNESAMQQLKSLDHKVMAIDAELQNFRTRLLDVEGPCDDDNSSLLTLQVRVLEESVGEHGHTLASISSRVEDAHQALEQLGSHVEQIAGRISSGAKGADAVCHRVVALEAAEHGRISKVEEALHHLQQLGSDVEQIAGRLSSDAEGAEAVCRRVEALEAAERERSTVAEDAQRALQQLDSRLEQLAGRQSSSAESAQVVCQRVEALEVAERECSSNAQDARQALQQLGSRLEQLAGRQSSSAESAEVVCQRVEALEVAERECSSKAEGARQALQQLGSHVEQIADRLSRGAEDAEAVRLRVTALEGTTCLLGGLQKRTATVEAQIIQLESRMAPCEARVAYHASVLEEARMLETRLRALEGTLRKIGSLPSLAAGAASPPRERAAAAAEEAESSRREPHAAGAAAAAARGGACGSTAGACGLQAGCCVSPSHSTPERVPAASPAPKVGWEQRVARLEGMCDGWVADFAGALREVSRRLSTCEAAKDDQAELRVTLERLEAEAKEHHNRLMAYVVQLEDERRAFAPPRRPPAEQDDDVVPKRGAMVTTRWQKGTSAAN